MDILHNTLPDEHFYQIQLQLIEWLRKHGFSTWRQIQKACKNLLATYTKEYSSQYGDFPEYKLFMPLLRNGICEIAKDENTIGFVLLTNFEEHDNVFNPVLLLNNFPEIKHMVYNFKTDDSIALNLYCDLKDKYTYKPVSEDNLEIGIYKPENKVYVPTLIYDGYDKRIIPNYDNNPDAINIARCFVRCYEKQKMFIYHNNSKELNVCFYSELPILITRALILFDKTQLDNKIYNYPLSKNVAYHNIDNDVINELSRIFDKNCIEVLND